MAVKFEKLIEEMVKPIVKDPKGVKVKEEKSEEGLVYVLEVNPDDVGRVIGKAGKNASAIRTIIYAAASLEGVKVRLNIVTGDKEEQK